MAFGATIKLSNIDTGEEVRLPDSRGRTRPDLAKGTISIASPLARSLVGKQVGDEVKVRMPGGERTYEVLDISFR